MFQHGPASTHHSAAALLLVRLDALQLEAEGPRREGRVERVVELKLGECELDGSDAARLELCARDGPREERRDKVGERRLDHLPPVGIGDSVEEEGPRNACRR